MIYTAQIELTSNYDIPPERWQAVVDYVISDINRRKVYLACTASLLSIGLPIAPELVRLVEEANGHPKLSVAIQEGYDNDQPDATGFPGLDELTSYSR